MDAQNHELNKLTELYPEIGSSSKWYTSPTPNENKKTSIINIVSVMQSNSLEWNMFSFQSKPFLICAYTFVRIHIFMHTYKLYQAIPESLEN